MKTNVFAAAGLFFVGQNAFAAAVPLPIDMGSSLPVGVGGVVGVTAIALLIGAQLIKRRQ